jgi:leader peptidase (prepilin peptidase)/N-methyltransferase
MSDSLNHSVLSPLSRFFSYRRNRLVAIWAALGLLVIAYVVIRAAWQASGDRVMHFSDLILPRIADVVMASWLFFVGSSIGSFLNVVAWRMPRGESVNGRSHCPRCDAALSWKDNWPVFGWLALGGRCSTCRLPISPRYPIVESAVGLCMLWVGWRELYGGGMTLPFHPERYGRAGALWTPYITNEHLVTMAYHLVAIGVAWSLALVRYDGHRLPRDLVLVAFGLVIVPMLAIPGVAVVPWQVTMEPGWQSDGKYLDALMRIVTGLAAAVVIARSLARYLSPTADPKLDPLGRGTARLMDMVAILSVPAVVVGWQAVLAVTVLAIVIAFTLSKLFANQRDSLALLGIGVAFAMTIQLALWRTLHGFQYWPSVNTSPFVILAWAALVLVLPRCIRETPASRAESTQPTPSA